MQYLYPSQWIYIPTGRQCPPIELDVCPHRTDLEIRVPAGVWPSVCKYIVGPSVCKCIVGPSVSMIGLVLAA